MHTAEEMMACVGPYALKRMGKIAKRVIAERIEKKAPKLFQAIKDF